MNNVSDSSAMHGPRQLDLLRHVYQHRMSDATGKPILDHEDYLHKSKNLVAGVRRQI